jgi:hypothetical protein
VEGLTVVSTPARLSDLEAQPMNHPSGPAIVEAAISPLSRGVPAQTVDELVQQAAECVAAGAGIVHHHHDMRLDEEAAVGQLLETGAGSSPGIPASSSTPTTSPASELGRRMPTCARWPRPVL